MSRVSLASVTLASVFFASSIFTVQAYQLPTLNITARRYVSSTIKSGASVTVLTQEAIRQSGAQSIQEALNMLPQLSALNSSGITGIFMRGYTARDILITVDGVPLTDPGSVGGAAFLDAINLDSLDKIELVEGPQSALYGSQAIAGVLNFISKKTGNGYHLQIGDSQLRSGAYGSWDGGNTHVFASTQYQEDHSLSSLKNTTEKDKTEKGTYTLIWDQKWGGIDTHVMIQKNNSRVDYDDSFGRRDAPFYGVISQDIFSSRAHFYALPNIEQILQYGYTRTDRRYEDNFPARFQGVIESFSHTAKATLSPYATWFTSLDATSESWDYYTQSRLGIGNHLSIDHDLFHTDARVRVEKLTQNDTQWITTYGLGFYRMLPGIDTLVKANLATGFRLPSVEERYSPFGGNLLLKPEQSFSKDISFEKNWGPIQLSLTIFESLISQKIIYQSTSSLSGNYANLDGLTRSTGIVYSGSIQDFYGWFLKGGYTNQLALNDQQKPLPRIPQEKWTLLAQHPLPSGTLSLSIISVGARQDGTHPLEAYTLLHSTYTLPLSAQHTLSVTIKNLTNTAYEEVYGYNTPERQVLVGLTAQWQ